jgi:glycine/D-amino acid oxidase-like deaminating enzyme
MRFESPFAELPRQAPVAESSRRRVVVIGGGVVGLSCGLWLLKAGHSVTVIDRQALGAQASFARTASLGTACTIALGACLPLATPGIWAAAPTMLLDHRGPLSIYWRDILRLTPWLIAFLKSSRRPDFDRIVSVLGGLLRLAEAGHAPLIEESGAGGLLRRGGCLYLYRTPKQFADAKEGIALRKREGVNMEILDAEAIGRTEPSLAPLYHKGVRFTDAYHLDTPSRYALALADAIRGRGGEFVQGEARGLASANDGVEAILEHGRLKADRIVVACGAWSRPLAASMGDRVLLDTERGYHVLFPDGGSLLSEPCCYPELGFYLTPLEEGLRAAGTVELGGLDAPPRAARIEMIARAARKILPQLGQAGRAWVGFRPSMPDSLPVIGPSPHDARVLYAFGHGHIGLTLAGVTGRIVSDLISGFDPPLDIEPLRPARFH